MATHDGTSPLHNCLMNLENGNLKTAKSQANRYSVTAIKDCAEYEFGLSKRKAYLAAHYLKQTEEADWQAYCDAR